MITLQSPGLRTLSGFLHLLCFSLYTVTVQASQHSAAIFKESLLRSAHLCGLPSDFQFPGLPIFIPLARNLGCSYLFCRALPVAALMSGVKRPED